VTPPGPRGVSFVGVPWSRGTLQLAICRLAIKTMTKEAGVAGLPDSLEGIPVEVQVTGDIVPQ
jgi:hypothetical protein